MFVDFSKIRIFVRPGTTDFRKQINGLSIMVQDDMELDSLSNNLFLFCNKKRNRLKVLYWDKNGFCLWLKRLEKDRFPWPKEIN
jgi:transposase